MPDALPQRKKRGRQPAPLVSVGDTLHKHCSRCKELKPLTAFRPGRKRLKAQCVPCDRRSQRECKERIRNGTAKKMGPSKLRKERFLDGVRQKFCPGCDSWLHEAAFARSKSKYDGLHAYCLRCNRIKQAKERARRGEDYREMRRRYRATPEGRAAYLGYRNKHPTKYAAHKATQLAVKEGRLIRPEVCEQCHEPGRIDSHHDDYSKPLEVRWLCRWCHQAWHRTHGEAANASSVRM